MVGAHTWGKWAIHRNQNLLPGEAHFNCSIEALSVEELAFWLSRFVLEIRREDGKCYPPNSLYQLCCGLLRHLNGCGRPEVNMFQQAEFRKCLDAEMKRLNSTGMLLLRGKLNQFLWKWRTTCGNYSYLEVLLQVFC